MSRVKEIRNHIHSNPEPSNHEEKTAAYLAGELKKAGYDVLTGISGHGVVGTIKGKEAGPVLALRGDMDALLHVVGGKETAVHSCGHDANCAMVLSMAEEIAKTGIKRGTLKIIFQPAEENLTGAVGMLEAGVADDIDYMMGIHLRPVQEAKLGQATAALYHGASTMYRASIHGKVSHGARPHLGVNAIDAAMLVVNAINTIKENPGEAWSAKTTIFNSNGVVTNAVPDRVDLAFDIRSAGNDIMDSLVKKVTNIVETAPQAIGATGKVESIGGVPGSEYDQEMIDLVGEAIINVMGKDALIPPIITPGGDDFHFYKRHKPSIKAGFVGLGADLTPGLHDPAMKFNDDALPNGVKILVYAVNKILN